MVSHCQWHFNIYCNPFFIDKSAQNAKYKILQPMQKKDNLKNTDTYQIYLDKREFHIIVSIYYGINTSTPSV